MTSECDNVANSSWEELHHETFTWLAQLPKNVHPSALVEQFPRVINRIAKLWGTPLECGNYLDSLLFGTRDGTREGFPYAVAFELSYLKALTKFRVGQENAVIRPDQINICSKFN